MPNMPTLDIVGLTGLSTLILVALAVFWGVQKAILVSKH